MMGDGASQGEARPRGGDQGDVQLALVGAATDLIAAKGVDGFTVSEVTEQVGIALGSFYRYFDSKEDLIEAAILDHRAMNDDLRAYIEKGESDPVELIEFFLSRNLTVMATDPVRAGFERAVMGHPTYARLVAADARALLVLNPPADELAQRRSEFMVSLLKGLMIAAHEYASAHPEIFDDEQALADAMTIVRRIFGTSN